MQITIHNDRERWQGETFTSRGTKRKFLRASYPKIYDPVKLGLDKRGFEKWERPNDEKGKPKSKEEDWRRHENE